jgi:iron complex transport system ATP-binding protein
LRGDQSADQRVLAVRGLELAIAGRTLCGAFDWAVRTGEIWAVIGPNGAGKTTLLRTLAGLAAPAAGEIVYGDAALAALDPRERARRRAFLPQDSFDAFPASVLETVRVGRHPHLPRFAWEGERDLALAHAALATFGLDALAERDVRTLSGGERRRVALAALLAQDSPLLLLDEPSSHLDIAQQATALDVLARLARERGKALVMVLHDLHLATRYCAHALLLGQGRVEVGPATGLLRADKLSALFGRTLRELRDGELRTFVPK